MLHKGAARGAARPRHGAAGRLRRLKPLEAVGQNATQPMSGSWRTSGTLEQDSRTLQTRSARSLHRSAEVKELARHVHSLRPAQPPSLAVATASLLPSSLTQHQPHLRAFFQRLLLSPCAQLPLRARSQEQTFLVLQPATSNPVPPSVGLFIHAL
jgi:hypothetical protein